MRQGTGELSQRERDWHRTKGDPHLAPGYWRTLPEGEGLASHKGRPAPCARVLANSPRGRGTGIAQRETRTLRQGTGELSRGERDNTYECYNMNENWNEAGIRAELAGLPIGGLRFLPSTSSTNTVAASWAAEGAQDLALVVADHQSAGRGRLGRKWHTPPGAAIAASIILQDPEAGWRGSQSQRQLLYYTALGALAVCQALQTLYGLSPQVKWPNDVLLEGQKVCGVLAEAHWLGERLSSIILGIGLNIKPGAIPGAGELSFPATCVQAHVQAEIDRPGLLREVVSQVIDWRSKIKQACFIQAWQERLAFRGSLVQISYEPMPVGEAPSWGEVIGLDADGQLLIKDPAGNLVSLDYGEIRIRPSRD